MADGRAERPARTSAQELVERFLAEQRAKTAARHAREHGGERSCDDDPVHVGEQGCDEAVRAGDHVYEDEPIIKTGSQFVRDRLQREKREARSKAAYVHQASSREDASWRELMAHGTVRRLKGNAMTAVASCRENSAHQPRKGGSELFSHGESVPEWRRPAREASLAGFSLEDESGRSFGTGAEPLEPVELPPLLQELRALEREDAAFLKSRDWLFVRQAKLAADYEDDFEYEGAFQHYFPTYQAMDDRQLRGYFAWRTRARQGRLERTSLSFAFVRLYELLNSVGAASPEEGFERLRAFVEAYSALDSRIERYARVWLHDYVIYHGLDRGLLDVLDEAGGPKANVTWSTDEALAVLAAPDSLDERGDQALGSGEGHGDALGVDAGDERAVSVSADDRLFMALCALSSYRLDTGRFYRDEPELARRAACEAWRALSAYYRKHRKRTFFESLFGRSLEVPYPMFRSAVFYGETRHADAVYEITPVRRFVCRGGRWSEEAYHEAKGRNKDLGRVMKALDRTLRRQCGSKHQIKGEPVPKYAQDILDGVVGRLLEERRQAEERARAVRVEIDFSKLRSIRAAAAATREALLIDEERSDAGEEAVFASTASAPGLRAEIESRAEASLRAEIESRVEADMRVGVDQHAKVGTHAEAELRTEASGEGAAVPPPPLAASSAAGLTKSEVAYLRCLAEDAPADERAAVLERAGVMESLMVDAVNEKLYDLLGDIAIEDAGEGPALVEDYADDVKGYAGL